MKKELIYIFQYKLANGVIGEIEIKADSYYNACEKFNAWKIEFGLDNDSDHEIIDLCYRVSGLTDIYSQEQRDIKKNKYVLINMETLRISILKNKLDFENQLAPLDKAEDIDNNNIKELVNNLEQVIQDYEINLENSK